MQPVEAKKKTSPWLYVGIGCGVLLLLGIGGTVAAVIFGMNQFKSFKEDMSNPVVRTEKVKKILGAQTLPDGYSAVMALSVPMIMDTAILSSHDPDGPKKADDEETRIFMYMFLKAATPRDQQSLQDYIEGRSDDSSVLSRSSVRLRNTEFISRGSVPIEGRKILYLSQRGELETGQHENKGPQLNTLALFGCPGDSLVRLGIWMAPDPSPETPIKDLDLKGTPADPEAISAFMSHFDPCQGS